MLYINLMNAIYNPKSVIRDFFRAKSQIIVGGVIIIVSVY